jgi:ankyrin repeat protein
LALDYLQKIILDFELQNAEGIKECFRNGIHPNDYYDNYPLIYKLINFYPRGPQFKECIKAFVEYGLQFDDKVLLAVLQDDAILLDTELSNDPENIKNRYSFNCTFTPLFEATLLHICAEYNHLDCAKILVQYGADVNARAGIDEFGFGGQTPIFHTVNQNENRCVDVMKFLISKKAELQLTVKGFVWGKGYEWETFIPAVNPISYAMMGLLPQFQRKEILIYEVVSILLKAAYGINYVAQNIPNAYLKND